MLIVSQFARSGCEGGRKGENGVEATFVSVIHCSYNICNYKLRFCRAIKCGYLTIPYTCVTCVERRNIYASVGVYRLDPPTRWPVAELQTQINISRDAARRDLGSLGNILFSAKYFRDNTSRVRSKFVSDVYTKHARVPHDQQISSEGG